MPSEAAVQPTELRRVTPLWPGVVIAAIAVAVYLPAFTTGFNADDYLILWRIKTIDGLAAPLAYFKFAFYEYFRPVGFLSYALDWRLWHLNPFGFHLTNVSLHAANALLVYLLLKRLFHTREAALGALLFAVHPASHEVVYWIAARFDLLATFFVLVALICLQRREALWLAIGAVAFGLALLSKESAIALCVIAPAWDALIEGRDWRTTARRLVMLLSVVAIYVAIRNLGADLDATGGTRRLPKALMTAAAVAGALWLAWDRDRGHHLRAASWRPNVAWVLVATVAGLLGVVALTQRWAFEKLGFVAHVTFHGISPVIFPSPPEGWFTPASLLGSVPHVMLVAAIFTAAWLGWKRERALNVATFTFITVFIAAALVPVSSMTGGLRYLYLPVVGLAMLAAALLGRVPSAAARTAGLIVTLMLAVSVQQIQHAGRAWRAASIMTRDGVTLMAGTLTRCGEDDVLLLTTPVAIGDVYANLSWDAFEVLAGCPPRSFMTLLRVVHSDLRASITSPGPDLVELRVAGYSGNIIASRDLRNFTIPIARGERTTLETPAGLLRTFPEGDAQVFQLTMTPEARMARRFYYSDGRIRQ